MSIAAEANHTCAFLWPHIRENVVSRCAVIILTVSAMLISVPGNILTVTTIFNSHKLRTEPAYLFICSVCVADLIVSLGAQSLLIATFVMGTRYSCLLDNVYFLVAWMASIASTFGVILITADRYVYIMYPFQYQEMMTKRRAKLAIASVWVCGIMFGILPQLYYNTVFLHISIFAILFLMTVFMTFTYANVFSNMNKNIHNVRNKARNQATRTILFVVITFFGCWYPWTIVSLVIAIVNDYKLDTVDTSPNSTILTLHWIFLAIGYSNSAINVFVYSRKNTVLRCAVERFLGRRSSVNETLSLDQTQHQVSSPVQKSPFASMFRRTVQPTDSSAPTIADKESAKANFARLCRRTSKQNRVQTIATVCGRANLDTVELTGSFDSVHSNTNLFHKPTQNHISPNGL